MWHNKNQFNDQTYLSILSIKPLSKFITQKIIPKTQCCFFNVKLASDNFSTVDNKFSITWPAPLYNMSFFCSWYIIKHPFDWSKVPVIFLSNILQLIIKLHFWQLSLNHNIVQWQLSCDVIYVHSCVWINYLKQVLFQQVVVQKFCMVVDNLISLDFSVVLLEHVRKCNNRWWEMGLSDLLDGLNMAIDRELKPEFTIQQWVDIVLVIAHNFTENHVLETVHCSGIICSHQGLQWLVKVWVCGLVVLIMSIQNTWHKIDFSKNWWLTVNVIGVGSWGS